MCLSSVRDGRGNQCPPTDLLLFSVSSVDSTDTEQKGPNKVPALAIFFFSLVTLGLVLAGNINQLAPIVTIPFLITYASVEYAYFNMAVTYRIQVRQNTFDPPESKYATYDICE